MTGIDQPFADEGSAIQAAEDLSRDKVRQLAIEAGTGDDIEIAVELDFKRAHIESRDMLVEAKIIALATGRPPIAQN